MTPPRLWRNRAFVGLNLATLMIYARPVADVFPAAVRSHRAPGPVGDRSRTCPCFRSRSASASSRACSGLSRTRSAPVRCSSPDRLVRRSRSSGWRSPRSLADDRRAWADGAAGPFVRGADHAAHRDGDVERGGERRRTRLRRQQHGEPHCAARRHRLAAGVASFASGYEIGLSLQHSCRPAAPSSRSDCAVEGQVETPGQIVALTGAPPECYRPRQARLNEIGFESRTGREGTMSRLALSKLLLAGGVLVSLRVCCRCRRAVALSARSLRWRRRMGARRRRHVSARRRLALTRGPGPGAPLHQPGGELADRRSLQSQSQGLGQAGDEEGQ